MFQINVGYPSADEEVQIVKQMTTDYRPALRKVLSPEQILELQEVVLRVPAAPHVVSHAVAILARQPPDRAGRARHHQEVRLLGGGAARVAVPGAGGQGPRHPERALRRLHRRRPALAAPVLVHRVLPNFHAEADGLDAHKLVDRLIQAVKPA